MNNIQLRNFSAETLLQVSKIIDKRTYRIRETPPFGRTKEEQGELDNLLTFQTQVLYARELVLKEENVLSN